MNMMRWIALLFLLLVNVAHGKAYKCKVNGKTVYQQRPCKTGVEFRFKKEVTPAQRSAALERLKNEIEQREKRRQEAQEELDKRRLLNAEVIKARAAQESAVQQKRQAEALEKRNQIELKKRRPVYLYR